MSGRVYLSVAIALSGLASWVGPSTPGWAVSAEAIAETGRASEGEAIAQAPNPEGFTVLHVNPRAGNNFEGNGTQRRPLQTITYALSIAQPNTLILLSEGIYSADTGEDFPLQLRSGVTVQGAAGPNTADVVILGGAAHVTPSQGLRNITILGEDSAGLANVTVSNPHSSGIGLWIESESPIIQEAAFFQNGSTGIYIAAGGSPVIRDSYFSENGEAGLVITGPSSAQVQGNIFENTGTGISVAPEATPAISDNRISHNEDGLVLHADARPALDNNQILRNRRNSILDYAPWSGTAAASAPQATQPPPPSIPAAAIAPPTIPSQPLAIGGISADDGQIATIPRPPANTAPPAAARAIEPSTDQTANTVRPPTSLSSQGGVTRTDADNPQQTATIRPPTNLVPETVAPDPLFSDQSAVVAETVPTNPPQAQTVDELAPSEGSNTELPELAADATPEPVAIAPAAPQPLTNGAGNDAAQDNLHSADASISPVEIRVINNRQTAVLQPLPTASEDDESANSLNSTGEAEITTDAEPTWPAPGSAEIATVPVIPTTALFSTVNLAPTLQVPEALSRENSSPTVTAENDAAVADNAAAGNVDTSSASSNPDASLRPSDVVPSLRESSAVEVAAVPIISTTTLFSTVDLTPTLQVPEAITDAIANQATTETSENDGLIADETEASTVGQNPDASLRPSDILASLDEPSFESDRFQPFSETDDSPEAGDSPEAIDLRIIPPPVDSIAAPTQASLGLRENRLAFSEEPLPNSEASFQDAEALLQDTGNLPDLPPLTANSSSAEVARILVPSSNIPVGSGGDLPELFAPGAPSSEGPPPPPSRASALGLPYKVLVNATDSATQNQLRQEVPDAFRVVMNDQEFMQAGAYPTLTEAQALVERLNQQGFQAQIEHIP